MADERVEVYGFVTDDLEGVRARLEAALGLAFGSFESPTIGPYYFAPLCPSHAELTLRLNEGGADGPDAEPPEEGLAEPDFPSYAVLLYVEWQTQSHGCRDLLRRIEPDARLLFVEE